MCKYTNICILFSDFKMFYFLIRLRLASVAEVLRLYRAFQGFQREGQICLVCNTLCCTAREASSFKGWLFNRPMITLSDLRPCLEPGSGKSQISMTDSSTQVRNSYTTSLQSMSAGFASNILWSLNTEMYVNLFV